MGDVIHVSFTPLPKDGGRARIKRKRAAIQGSWHIGVCFVHVPRSVDDLVMDHVDNGTTATTT
jgi:hypothetical protein